MSLAISSLCLMEFLGDLTSVLVLRRRSTTRSGSWAGWGLLTLQGGRSGTSAEAGPELEVGLSSLVFSLAE